MTYVEQVLALLNATNCELTTREISEILNISPDSVSGAIRRLCDKGLVEKGHDRFQKNCTWCYTWRAINGNRTAPRAHCRSTPGRPITQLPLDLS